MPQRADDERQTEDAVAGDHHRGEHRVARQRRGLVAAGRHQRDDQRDLDDRHREREDQRAERFADPMGDDFGVMDGGDHRRAETGADQDQQHRAQVTTPGQQQDDESERGHGQTPARQPLDHGVCHPQTAYRAIHLASARSTGDASRIMTVQIRIATDADWPAIWPFFHEIVTARETYTYDPELTEEQARALWMSPSSAALSRTTVAVDADGTVLGSANMYPNRPGPGAHVASASFMVDGAARGKGVGRLLCEDMIAGPAARASARSSSTRWWRRTSRPSTSGRPSASASPAPSPRPSTTPSSGTSASTSCTVHSAMSGQPGSRGCGRRSSRITRSRTSRPDTRQATDALGLKGGWMSYFGCRAAPLGPVGPDAGRRRCSTTSTRRWSLARCRTRGPTRHPAQLLDARLTAVDNAVRRLFPDASFDRAAEVARRAAELAPVGGRPIAAANAALEWPDEPHLVLWQATTILRESRGDGHVAALVGAGLSPCQACLTISAAGGPSKEVFQVNRRWSDEDWAAAEDDLRESRPARLRRRAHRRRASLRQQVEDTTDALADQGWRALGDDLTAELHDLVHPLSAKLMSAGRHPTRQPDGDALGLAQAFGWLRTYEDLLRRPAAPRP